MVHSFNSFSPNDHAIYKLASILWHGLLVDKGPTDEQQDSHAKGQNLQEEMLVNAGKQWKTSTGVPI